MEEALKRAVYNVFMEYNGISIFEVIIDDHYKCKHPEVNDEIILGLISKLHMIKRIPMKVVDAYSYFVEEPIYYESKPYRLIFLIEENKSYIGVVNAFRIKEKKWDFHQKKI